jgi:hypothetical protein
MISLPSSWKHRWRRVKIANDNFYKSEPLFHHFDLIFAPPSLDLFSWNKRLQTRQRRRLESCLLLPYKQLELQKQERDLLVTDSWLVRNWLQTALSMSPLWMFYWPLDSPLFRGALPVQWFQRSVVSNLILNHNEDGASKLFAAILKYLNPFLIILISSLHPWAWISLSGTKDYKANENEGWKLACCCHTSGWSKESRNETDSWLTRDW